MEPYVIQSCKSGDEDFSDTVRDELEKRRIVVGKDVAFGGMVTLVERSTICDGARIGRGVKLCTGVCIGQEATIGDNVSVGRNAIVERYCVIADDSSIGSYVVIDEAVSLGSHVCVEPYDLIGQGTIIGCCVNVDAYAFIGAYVRIRDGVRIGQYTDIGGTSVIGERAYITPKTCIRERSRIGTDVVTRCIYIKGSKYPVEYWGEDRVSIGCTMLRIDAWLTRGECIADRHAWKQEEKEEYRQYITFIKSVHESKKAEEEGKDDNE
jgi:UDP-3-O-[3-hydroxymyristoyl] glucosamine N-acyltransferase